METKFKEKCSEVVKFYEKKLEVINKVETIFNMDEIEFAEFKTNKIRETLRHAKANSSFYKEKFKDIEFTDEFFEDKDFITKLPFTEKKEIVNQYPFGLLASDMKNIVRYGESSGTTANPINSYYTREDWIANNATVAKCLSNIVSKEDVVAVIVPYELALVGQDLDRALEMLGATTIALGSLTKCVDINRVVKMLKSLEVTTVICSPTRLLFIAKEAINMGYNPQKDFKIKKLLCPGEGTSTEKEKLIKEIWGARTYPMYGMTETNTLAMPCSCGHLHLVENKALFEIVDPNTGEELGDNQRGELVITTLLKGMPLIRYRTGDLCTISTEPCECNGKTRIIKHHGRISDRIIVNDKSYQILDLEEVILSISHAKFYTLKVLNNQILEICLVLSEDECAAVKPELEKAMEDKFGIKVNIDTTNMTKIEQIIKIAIKPSIKSILLN